MANVVQVVITAKDNASGTLKGIGSAAGGAAGAIKKGFSGLGNVFGKALAPARKMDDALQKIGQQMAAAQAVFSAFKQVADFAELGAQSERMERRFAAFAEEAGGAEAMMQAFSDGVGGAASKMESMASASKLLQMGLVSDAEGMRNVTEMASRLGDQTQSVGDRILDFSLMLANQSVMRLDNFGISSGKVRERMAELQEQTKGLSRETAFMQATMEIGGESLAKLGPRVEDNMMAFEKAQAKMADTRVEIGKKLVPAVSELMGVFSGVLDIVSPLVDVFANLFGRVIELAGSVPLLGDAFSALGDALNLEAAAEAAEQLAVLGDSAKVSEGTISEWSTQADEMMANGASLGDVMRELAGRVNGTSAAFEDGGILADIFVDQQGIMGDAAEAIGQIILGNARNYDEYTMMIDRYNATVTDSGAAVSAMTQRQFELRQQIEMNNQALASGEGDMFNYAAEMEHVQRAAGEVVPAVDAANVAFMEMEAPSMGQIGADLESAAAAQQALREQQELAIETANNAADAYTNMAISLQGATEQQIAQQLIGMLDPEAMGAEAFIAATTEIGEEFGLMDEKSIALAENLPLLAEAIEMNVIPAQNADEALKLLVEDAADGQVAFENIVAAMGPFPVEGEAAALSTQALIEQIKGVDEASPGAVGGLDSMTGSAGALKTPLDEAESSAGLLYDKLNLLEGTWEVEVKYTTTGTPPPGTPEFQHGGIVPGPIGQPTLAVVHGGEVVTNPNLPGSVHNSYGGNTYNVTLSTDVAVAAFSEQIRQQQLSRFDARM